MTVPVRLSRRLARRLFTLGVVTTPVLAVLLATPVAPVAPAAASPSASCVGVIVDARLLGGPLRTACAPGDPRTGLAALTAVGIGYAFVPRFPGLVCSLGGQPECTKTSASTYWSYWHRAPGSTRWVYAAEGADAYDPTPGSTEGWVWQDGGRRPPPGIPFSSLCTTCGASSPRPTSSPSPPGSTSRPSPSRPSTPRPSTTRASTAPLASPRPSTTRTAAAPPTATASTSTAPSTSAVTPPVPASSPPSPAVAASSATSTSTSATSHGLRPWTGTAAGAGVIALLAGAALRRARARRPSR